MMPGRRAVLVAVVLSLAACQESPTDPASTRADRDAGQWQTWVLASTAVVRPSAPAADGSVAEQQELQTLLTLQDAGAPDANEIARWDGPPTTAWTAEAARQLELNWILLPDVQHATPVRAARSLALMHVAIYDALVATWDAKYTYNRRSPYRADRRVQRLARDPGVPSYPSEHAAAAGAAATVLAYAFPLAGRAYFDSLAMRAALTRVAAGLAWPTDVQAGLALGRAVGEAVVARARADGSDLAWDGRVPNKPDVWKPTPPRRVAVPFDPMAGHWRTWVIDGADTFRPPPYPAVGSAEFERDMDELRGFSTGRTPEQLDIARFWATGPPPLRWTLFMEEEVAKRRLSTMQAARAHAYASVAMHDAMLACWDAKYFYWLLRPISADSARIVTAVSTPPFPSYPSGHSTMSYAASQVFAELFPDARAKYREKAEEASLSRVYGAIHYRFDIVVGDTLGARVGREVVRRLQNDGAR
jgi:membrane-associated phospholipid phosphatase